MRTAVAVFALVLFSAHESIAQLLEKRQEMPRSQRVETVDPGMAESARAALQVGAPSYSVKSGPTCTGGIQHDDGSFEDGIRTTSTLAHNFVTRFDLPGAINQLDAVCVCFSRSGSDTSVTFRVNVYANDGPSGGPGTLLGFVTPNVATPPLLGQQFVRVPFPSLVVPQTVYIGPSWSELLDDDFFLCTDDNGPAGPPSYFGTDLVAAPTNLAPTTSFRALGIRAEATSLSDCVASETAMCLNNNRFKVSARWRTPDGTEGDAKVFKLTPDTGYLWFFNASNVETVVKVLDACGFNQRFWVFAGGLTNVQVTLTVEDTETGQIRTYTNPQNTAFRPIQDTSAFATCQ
jgi:hypothetical protein